MTIDRRITNGLAWAGVLLVVGVPMADLVSAQFAGPSATLVREQVAVVEPVAPVPAPLNQRPAAPVAKPSAQVAVAAPEKPTAPVLKPTVRPAAQTADIVDQFLQSGKPLPSYITGANAPTAQAAATPPVRTPIVTTPAAEPVAADPVQVASIPPQKVAPVPMPLSMRPRPVAALPPADIIIPPGVVRPSASITADDLADWEAGPLSEFLAARQRQGGPAVVVDPEYDPNGFFLDQGPNPRRRDRVIGWQEESFSFFAD